ncbi:MAG: molybdenum cofactor guanylyltransferase [Fidelibacterota bacterium]
MIPVSAFILIGGNSKRFGSPKWQAKIKDISVLDIIWKTCEIFQSRYIIGKESPDECQKPFLEDLLEIQAPINGLYTALSHSKTDWIFLISCDLPLTNQTILQELHDKNNHHADVIIPLINKRAQVTCAFYHKRILSFVTHRISQKKYSLTDLVESINTQWINMDHYEIEFTNMNTRKDYETIREILKAP